MIPIPPWTEVWDALRLLAAPTFAASVLTMFLIRSLTGEKWSPLAAVLGIAAGVFVGNYFRETADWRIDSDRALNTNDIRTVLGWSLEAKPNKEIVGDAATEEPLPLPPARYWLLWAGALAMVIDLAARCHCASSGFAWSLRTLMAIFAGRLLTPAELRLEDPWVSWALGASMISLWAILHALSREWKDGAAAAALSLCFAASAIVALYAHSGRFMDMAMLFSVALAGVAVIAWIRPSDTGGALAAAAIALPALMLNAQQETFSEVPWRGFALAGVAPLAMLPLLLPFLIRQRRWLRWFLAIGLPLIPAIWAVIIAASYETVQF